MKNCIQIKFFKMSSIFIEDLLIPSYMSIKCPKLKVNLNVFTKPCNAHSRSVGGDVQMYCQCH